VGEVGLVIPAAGKGERFGGSEEKALVPLAGKPLLTRALLAFAGIEEITRTVVAVPPGRQDAFAARALRPFGLDGRVTLVAGGTRRQDSVAAGIEALPPAVTTVLVHDAARPLVAGALIRRVLARATAGAAAVPAIPSRDSVARRGAGGSVTGYEDRAALLMVQTPQGFPRRVLEDALRDAAASGVDGTDEAMLVLRRGGTVTWVDGDGHNMKITFPEDLAVAETLLALGGGER
jgi:2-C-methyl-D-erythritol 4-phosphate cytidylyltransferase